MKEPIVKQFKVGDIVTSLTWELMSQKNCKGKIVYMSKKSEEICIENESGLIVISYSDYDLKKVQFR